MTRITTLEIMKMFNRAIKTETENTEKIIIENVTKDTREKLKARKVDQPARK